MTKNIARDGFGGAIANSAKPFNVSNGSMARNIATNGGAISISPTLGETPASNILNLNFILKTTSLFSNEASNLGGGMFIDVNFMKKQTSSVEKSKVAVNSLSDISFLENMANSGAGAYWTRASSPQVAFSCENCHCASSSSSTISNPYATEALAVQAPITTVNLLSNGFKSGSVAESFSVEFVDYYGNVAIAEPST